MTARICTVSMVHGSMSLPDLQWQVYYTPTKIARYPYFGVGVPTLFSGVITPTPMVQRIVLTTCVRNPFGLSATLEGLPPLASNKEATP